MLLPTETYYSYRKLLRSATNKGGNICLYHSFEVCDKVLADSIYSDCYAGLFRWSDKVNRGQAWNKIVPTLPKHAEYIQFV